MHGRQSLWKSFTKYIKESEKETKKIEVILANEEKMVTARSDIALEVKS